MEPVGTIVLKNVTKRYHITQRATPRMGAWFLSKAFEYFRREPFEALDGVSLRIEPGEMVGLLGMNGAGKSTVLKLIAGITDPTSGAVAVSGPVTSLLELGVGFHPDLTGMENIFYNGALMGMSRATIHSRLEAIVAFSGLSEFLYEPVKHYSSGMYSRLACSVALHLEPRIILVDEILAVGDAEFQQRSILKLLELHESGVTTLLVTHETNTARDICSRLIWIDEGRVRLDGAPATVHKEYMRFMMARVPRREPAATNGASPHRIEGLEFLVDGEPGLEIDTGQAAEIRLGIVGDGTPIRVALTWRWTDGRLLCEDISEPIRPVESRAELSYRIPRFPLIAARITVTVSILDVNSDRVLAEAPEPFTLEVRSPGILLADTMISPRVKWDVKMMNDE